MKQVLFLKSLPAIPIMGADISVFERIALLKDYGWLGKVISTGREDHSSNFQDILLKLNLPFSLNSQEKYISFIYAGVEGRIYLIPVAEQATVSNSNLFKHTIAKLNPHALMGNIRDPIVLSYLADNNDKPSLMFLTEDEFTKRGMPGDEDFYRCLKNIKKIAVASRYLQESLNTEYGITPILLTNAIMLSNYRQVKEEQGKYITIMHPYPHKGIDIFLQIVEKMPERDFMVMSGTGKEYRDVKPKLLSYPNLRLQQHTKSVKDIYKQSRLLIIPSLWQEAFSRVIIEAYCSGTPVICSDKGGVREAGRDAASYVPVEKTQDAYDVSKWLQAIKKFDDIDYYKKMSMCAISRISEFEAEQKVSLQELSKLLS